MSENINRLNDALLQVNSAYKEAVERGDAEEASRLAGQINTLGTEITRLRAVKDPAAMAAEADEMANATARDVVKAFPSSVIRVCEQSKIQPRWPQRRTRWQMLPPET
jgi:putative heme iron utilization protein